MSWPLLFAPAPGGGAQQNILGTILPFALVIAIFYFLLIAPARKQKKKVQEMLDGLQAGDKVVTAGGLYGTVVSVTDQVIRLRIASSVQVDVARSAITGKVGEEA
jgi:preprotein translocase subunit YajC